MVLRMIRSTTFVMFAVLSAVAQTASLKPQADLTFADAQASAQTSQLPPSAPTPAAPYRFKAAGEGTFEWFFLLVDGGKEQGIWAKNGLDPEFVPVAGSSVQLKERIDAGVQMGFVNAAEVTLARANGVPVKTVAGYFGETTARIFVAANGPIKTAKELDGKKIGIVATTHTSYRTVFYMNKKLAIKADRFLWEALPTTSRL